MIPIAGDNKGLERSREVNLVMAIGFLGQSVKSLRHSENAIESGTTDKSVTAGAIGLVCLAQGLELLFKAILLARAVPEPKGTGQHPLVQMYDLIAEDQALHEAIFHLLSDEGCVQPDVSARKIVELAQDGFFPARYLGLGKHTELYFPKSRLVSLFVFALVATNFGRYIEYVSEEMDLSINLHFEV